MNTVPFPPISFLRSALQLSQLPEDQGSEIAFIGRSNSGKSTAINTITGKKNLAKVSKFPGRTQLFNFFQITPSQRIVDLPGYGYARVSELMKKQWSTIITTYLRQRRSLKGLIITVDSRRLLKAIDLTMLNWTLYYKTPIHILLTKTDKLPHHQAREALIKTQAKLPFLNKDSVQLFSAIKTIGIPAARKRILTWLSIPTKSSTRESIDI